ncbi:cell division protein FtsA [Bacteroidia bacterium]|nr:cell division protein FtsA [Bacteroidia bacterium]
METNKYIAAIDLGSTKITGALARKTEDGSIEILAVKSVASKQIRYGEIKNVDETTKQIKTIVERLNNHQDLQENGLKINTVYTALGGRSLDTAVHTVKRLLGKEDKITEELLAEMKKENRNLKFGENEIFGVFEQEFLVDDEKEHAPLGMNCSNLQGRYAIIHGDSRLKYNLDRVRFNLESLGINLIYDQFASVAAARAALTGEDIEKGCAFIDFGAETTSLCVFMRGYFRLLYVFNKLTGKMITDDLFKNLNLTEEDAEKLKINFGNALAQLEESRNVFIPSHSSVEPLDTAYIAKMIEFQIDKILSCVSKEISDAGLSNYLGAGFVIAGGASKLRNLEQKIELATGRSTRRAKFDKIDNAVIWGLLKTAKEDCTEAVKKEIPQPEPEPIKMEDKEGLFQKVINWGNRLKDKANKIELSETLFKE